jgi:SAM-dependent methyltransferase
VSTRSKKQPEPKAPEPQGVPSQTHDYPTDVPYVRSFFRSLAPAWLDHVAIVSGFAPPARNGGFTFCELGCGQGVTPAILAATHPDGAFYGIDAMPSHIEHGRRFAAEAAIANTNFYAVDFTTAAGMGLPSFDYIVAHGVYSWVNAQSQAALRAFVDRHLKPGGLAYISYNAMPGRAIDVPLQRLVLELGNTLPGDSMNRLTAATTIVHRLVNLKPPALAASSFLHRLRKNKQRLASPYLVHELMIGSWAALWVTQVRAEMTTIGLTPVGSATLIQNFDSLILGRAARKALATISNDNVREFARDLLINQSFRCDVFVRAGRRLNEDERRRRLHAATYALARPYRAIKYTMVTPAGRLRFDSAAARSIVSILSAGPASLAEIIAKSTLPSQNLLANLLVLCTANAVWPVEPHRVSVVSVNEAIRRRLGGPEEIRYLALPCGTATAIDDGLLRLLRCGRRSSAGKHRDWQDFFTSHGLSTFGARKQRSNRRPQPSLT